jgi:hypothetical protein
MADDLRALSRHGTMRVASMPWTRLLAAAVFVLASTFVHAALPSPCTGVPGDLRLPDHPKAAVPAATHGPGVASPGPIRLAATGRQPHRAVHLPGSVPMLYVYNEHGGNASVLQGRPAALGDAVFEEAAKSAFWGEAEGDGFWSIPFFSPCEQTQLLGADFDFRAPSAGLLFVQFDIAECAACAKVDAAIERTIAAHPELPVRWVKFDLASTDATSAWCFEEYWLTLRENLPSDEIGKATCHK